jgi:ketosteroid isomerase-like protein
MTRRLLLCIMLFTCFIKTEAQSWDKEVEASIASLNKAMIEQDKSTLEKLTATELSYGHSTALIENKTEFVTDVLSGPVKFSKIESTNQQLSKADNIVLVRNLSNFQGIKNGAPMDLKIGILMVWRKQGDHWELLARQGYKLQ